MRECPKHGPYEARTIEMPFQAEQIELGCQRCVHEAQAKTLSFEKRAQQRLRSEKLRTLTSAAAIPEKYADASIDGYRVEFPGENYAKTVCSAFVRHWATQRAKGGSLVFCGKPGTGKTYLACAIGNEVMGEHMGTVIYGTVPEVVGLVRESFRDGSKRSEQQVLRDMQEPDLLILDEIGAQSGTDYELRTLFAIINGRYQAGRPMILISNLTPEQMEKTLGERVMDRFRECASIVPFNWASYRGRKQGEMC